MDSLLRSASTQISGTDFIAKEIPVHSTPGLSSKYPLLSPTNTGYLIACRARILEQSPRYRYTRRVITKSCVAIQGSEIAQMVTPLLPAPHAAPCQLFGMSRLTPGLLLPVHPCLWLGCDPSWHWRRVSRHQMKGLDGPRTQYFHRQRILFRSESGGELHVKEVSQQVGHSEDGVTTPVSIAYTLASLSWNNRVTGMHEKTADFMIMPQQMQNNDSV